MGTFNVLTQTALRSLGAVTLLTSCTLTQGVPLRNVPSREAAQPAVEHTRAVPATLVFVPTIPASSTPEAAPDRSTPPAVRPDSAQAPAFAPLTPPALPTLPAVQPPVAPSPPAGWQMYRNLPYGFEIHYPPSYVILPPLPPEPVTPQPLFEVLFQDQTIAGVDVERIEPPMFAIRVFDNRARQPLDDWLNRFVLSVGQPNLDVLPYPSGVKVCSRLMIAPGCFIYLANDDYVYQLTPLGELADQMAATFRFVR